MFSIELFNHYFLPWYTDYRLNLCFIMSPKWMLWTYISEMLEPERKTRKMHAFFDEGKFWKERLENMHLKCRKWQPVAKRFFSQSKSCCLPSCVNSLIHMHLQWLCGRAQSSPLYCSSGVWPLGDDVCKGFIWVALNWQNMNHDLALCLQAPYSCLQNGNFWGSRFLCFLYEKGSQCTDICYVYQRFWIDFFYSTWFYEV